MVALVSEKSGPIRLSTRENTLKSERMVEEVCPEKMIKEPLLLAQRESS